MKQNQQERQAHYLKNNMAWVQELFSGAVAGVVSSLCVAPMDVVKIRSVLMYHNLNFKFILLWPKVGVGWFSLGPRLSRSIWDQSLDHHEKATSVAKQLTASRSALRRSMWRNVGLQWEEAFLQSVIFIIMIVITNIGMILDNFEHQLVIYEHL